MSDNKVEYMVTELRKCGRCKNGLVGNIQCPNCKRGYIEVQVPLLGVLKRIQLPVVGHPDFTSSPFQGATIDSVLSPGCARCDGTGWVCENHPDRPWDGVSYREDACGCGAGKLCSVCDEEIKL